MEALGPGEEDARAGTRTGPGDGWAGGRAGSSPWPPSACAYLGWAVRPGGGGPHCTRRRELTLASAGAGGRVPRPSLEI